MQCEKDLREYFFLIFSSISILIPVFLLHILASSLLLSRDAQSGLKLQKYYAKKTLLF